MLNSAINNIINPICNIGSAISVIVFNVEDESVDGMITSGFSRE